MSARIATAYLTPDGFLTIKDQLATTGSVQLLLGERPFLARKGPTDRLGKPEDEELSGPSESIDWYGFLEGDYPWLLMTRDERKALADEPTSDSPFNLSAWVKVQELVRFLERDGVEIRRFLGDRAQWVPEGTVLSSKTAPKVHLHAKAYIFRGDEGGFAAVGSSNLTKGGLNDNVELNLLTHDERLVGDLEGWFDGKWLLGQDCKQEFIDALEDCVLYGRRFTPWQVFAKALDAAYGRFLDFAISEELEDKLAHYQQEAVSRSVALLDRHWGAMLADSVGLGKTYEGLGILSEFSRRRREATNKFPRALVICPAQLLDNWSGEKLSSYSVNGEAISMESLPMLVLDPDEEEQESAHDRAKRRQRLRYLQDFDVVLIDESHNFRNPETKRYQAAMEIIRGGNKPDKRVLLLTATPINNSPWDLYHQLSLITRGDDTWYAGRGPIANLRNTFRNIEKGGGGAGLLDAMLLSLVRRTRHDIRALQEAGQPVELGGQPVEFPKHEIPQAVAYSLGELYGPIYQQIIETIQDLNFAVYNLESYGVELDTTGTETQVQQRNRTFIGIMRTIFLKRMESSVVALTGTVRSMIEYLDLFLVELEQRNRVLTPKDALRLRTALGGSLPDDALESEAGERRLRKKGAMLPAAPADLAQRERLLEAVAQDRERLWRLLNELMQRQKGWRGTDDPKLASLRALLDSLPPVDRNGVPTKVVIFTNYKDTANYIFQALGGPESLAGTLPLRWRSNLSDGRWMSILTGADDRKRRNEVLQYFAPLAFTRESEPVDDPELLERIEPFCAQGIEVLIATDVLSEGQNLQDAQYLINYDLHWNPVRMIQRAGRIDRLFSPHERIFIYNVMPEKELESLLNLVKSLSQKVASIEEMVGLDASVLGEQIESKAFDKIMKLAAGGSTADEVYREGERAQGLDEAFAELNTYIQMVKDLGTEDFRSVPDGVYSIRTGREPGVFVMLRMPEELTGEVFWRFYPFSDPQPKTAPSEVIKLIEATREHERQELPKDANPFLYLERPLGAAVEQLGEEYKQQVAQQTQDDFSKRLAALLNRDDFLETEEVLWENLNGWRQNPPPTDALRRSRVSEAVRMVRQTKANAPLDEVVERLQALWDGLQAEGLDRPIERPSSKEPSVRDLELVCWELIVTEKMLRDGVIPNPETVGLSTGQTRMILA